MARKNRSKEYKTAFIVKDAKTYINAEEAWFKFSGKKEGTILFIIIPIADPNRTIPSFSEVIDTNKWEKIVWFKSLSNYMPRELKILIKKWKILKWLYNGKEYLFNYIDRIRLDRLANQYGPIKTVFSGHRDTQEHLAAKLNPRELYIMDSGMGIRDKIQSTGYIDYRVYIRRKRFLRLMHKLIGFQAHDRSKTKFFTVYKDSVDTKHEIAENDYLYRKSLVKQKEIGDWVIYISSPIYKRQNVDVQDYIHFVKDIFKHFDLKPSNVIYIPHPVHEKKGKVKKVVEALDCRIDDRDIPIETKITLYDTLPKMCITPYSSSLVNLSVFSENKFSLFFAWHYEFDCFEVLYNWKNQSLLKNTAVEVIPLVDTISLFGFDEQGCEKPLFKDFEVWDTAVNSNRFIKRTNSTEPVHSINEKQ
jgi:hypothetical protein